MKDNLNNFKQELYETHSLIKDTIAFWEDKMGEVVDKMDKADSIPDWHPDKEDVYHKLNLEMQFILKKLEAEEEEIDQLEERTNRLLAEKLFKKAKKVDGKKET